MVSWSKGRLSGPSIYIVILLMIIRAKEGKKNKGRKKGTKSLGIIECFALENSKLWRLMN